MADDGDYIRQLLGEARNIKTKPLPGAISLTANHPWTPGHAVDSPGEWEADQRRAYVLSRLAEKYPGGQGLSDPSMAQEVQDYQAGRLKDLTTPYHYRGWYTAGAPLHSAMQWMGAFPAMAYAASAGLANAVDPVAPYDKDAGKKWNAAVNTVGMGVPELVGMVPLGTKSLWEAGEQAKHDRGNVSFSTARQKEFDEIGAAADKQVDDMMIDGSEHYRKAGMPKTPALFMGALSDSLLDPYGGWSQAMKAASQGQRASAAWNLAKEWGLGQGFAGVAATGSRSDQP